MANPHSVSGVLLVGSIPLSSTEEVLTTVCEKLPGKLQWIPDGETGKRYYYINWQRDCFPAEARRIAPIAEGIEYPSDHPGFKREDVKPTRYEEAALESYQKFQDLQKRNVIPHGVRFQVSLPVPFDCIQMYLKNDFRGYLGKFYEQRLCESLSRILENIPAEHLAIQWDIAMMPAALEYERGRAPPPIFTDLVNPHFRPLKEGFVERIKPLCDMVPPEVHLGLHLCYGDIEHKHILEPQDTGILADLAQTFVKSASRPVQWVHMPVPKDRDDVGYFKPLQNMDIGSAKLFLGLVHAEDEEGTKRRIAAAQSVVGQDFGVATECGMGRTPAEQLESVLRISNNVTAPVSA